MFGIQDKSPTLNDKLSEIKADCYRNVFTIIKTHNYNTITQLTQQINMLLYGTFISIDEAYQLNNIKKLNETNRAIRESSVFIKNKVEGPNEPKLMAEMGINTSASKYKIDKNCENEIINNYRKDIIQKNSIVKTTEIKILPLKNIYKTPKISRVENVYDQPDDIEMMDSNDINELFNINSQNNTKSNNKSNIFNINNINEDDDEVEQEITSFPQRKFFIFSIPSFEELKYTLIYILNKRNIKDLQAKIDEDGIYWLLCEFNSRTKLENHQIMEYVYEIEAYNKQQYLNFFAGCGQDLNLQAIILQINHLN